MIATKSAPTARPAPPQDLEVMSIDRNPDNPREHFDESELAGLAASLKTVELLAPIHVRPHPKRKGRFLLVAGERRWRAAKLAGWHSIPAYVRELTPQQAAQITAAENFQRADLNPIEKAKALALLTRPADEGGGGLTNVAAGKLIGKSGGLVGNYMRLLKLPAEWQARVAAGELDFHKARDMVPYADRPEVLAAVADGLARNTQDWDSSKKFASQLAEIVARVDAALKPIADGSSPRVTRKEDSPTIVPMRRSAPVDHGSSSVAEKGDAGPGEDLVNEILCLVAELTTHAQIERVERSLRERAQALLRAGIRS